MLTHLTPLHLRTLAQVDPDIAKAIADETHRQNTGLELIASENFASAAVMAAAGSVMTNKYAEGYPGKRYYGGCEFVDVAEQLAIDRAKALFGAEHANVQPHSGAQANMSVFISLLDPGDTILGMNLAHGGHLTHGHPLNFSGKFYKVVPYGVREDDERLDYDELERLAHEHKPKLIIVGASAYSRIIDFERIATVAQATGARMFTDMAHIAGLVAGGVHPSPVPHSDYVTTTTHKTLRGPRGGLILTREANAKAIDRALFPGVQGGPLMHVIAAKAVCFREAMEMPFRAYQAQVATNARRLAQSLRDEGFRLVSGGTDNHLMLVDVFSKGITGKQAEKALGEAGITVNKNAIPFDKNPPMVASGIRVGTPAVTTRGMGEAEMDRIADLISAALREPENSTALGKVRAEVEDLCREFPLYPPPSLIDGVRRVLGTGGALAAVLDGFEPRASQQEMAEAVARVVTTGGVLLAEAGTGTGKTLAYLVPAILSGRKTLVSTGTRNLQQQLIDKDVPLLQRALGPFRATCMKGRNNYLCLHRFEQARLDERPRDDDTRVAIALIEHWAPRTQTGDRAEIANLPEDLPFWHTIAATTENCLGSECPRYSDCFVTRMRQEAADADVVIVNHHLLCADAALRRHSFGEVIPECQVGIIDEAHQLEDVATQYFGLSVSNFRIEQLFTDAAAVRTSPLFVPHEDAAAIARAIEALAVTARAFFLDLQTRRPGVRQAADGSATLFDERLRVNGEMLADAAGESGLQLIEALSTLEEALALLKDAPEDLRAIAKRAGEIRDDLKFLLRAEAEDYVYFLELRGRHVALRAAPIDVSHIIRDVLIDRLPALVLTSATLSIGGSFGYVRARLGVGESLEVKVPSEFDYRTQALVYLPRKMPDPRTREYAAALADEAAALLTASEGRAFLLFTSYAALRDAHARLSTRLPYPMLVQGTMPRGVLIEQFRKTPNAVLFGTASFWQGVDVVGEALSCVIIDRIPFASPGDPVVAARIEALQRRGIDAFAGFQVPLAILTLLQGVGRLIRHRQDRGVIALLDPRLQSMGYGRRFLNALPPAPVTRRPEDVTKFFAVRG